MGSLVIAGERSGVGKTTITLALLAALRQRKILVQSFKVGPDYIDPMFHQYVTGRACRNLDPVLTSEDYVQQCFVTHTQSVECAVVEGVMGLFDGASGADDWASTAHVARSLQLPVVLVIDCSRLSRSVAAIAHGYRSLDPRLQCAGVVLNRVGSDRHLELLKAALEPMKIPILGIFRRHDDITLPDRHLGLVPTAELPALDEVIDRLAHLGSASFNWAELLPLLIGQNMINKKVDSQTQASFPTAVLPALASPDSLAPIKIGVAYDRAFSFYYADNLERLEQLGAELVYWSPLADASLPDGIQGLYLGGGFPEVFAGLLSQNQPTRQAVQAAIAAGMPTYAECGGLMYLADRLIDFAGQSWEMVGALPTIAQMGQRLTLGYRHAVAQQDTPLLTKGTTVWGHEFHRSSLVTPPADPLYAIRGYDSQRSMMGEGWRSQQVHASYVHLHWGARPEIPARFIHSCRQFASS